MSKLKIHLLFAATLSAAVALDLGWNLLAGEQLPAAAWSALREIRPMDVLMLAGLCYGSVFFRPQDEQSSSLISLNLNARD
ncbi:MAG TPA: hypothetical protein VMS31_14345 [Pyrinomonadaceae bacterium]|nr:hypothetical protein [Pyrinomonadaceae bacterium]